MKQVFTIIAAVLLTASVLLPQQASAQAPQGLSYQIVIRDASNYLVTNRAVGMQISILQGSVVGAPVYVETQTPTTNTNALVSIEIGAGTLVSGDFASIDWADGPYFVKTETDPTGGTTYTLTGTSQFLTVPYALHAKTIKLRNYSIGDFAHGGIVFWVDETGQHGLVCAKEDQSTGVRWYAGTSGDTQAKGDGPGAGKANTSIIIAAQVAIGNDYSMYAARICNEVIITEQCRSYCDWYLPSRNELGLMSNNKAIIDVTADANGGSSFDGRYWSSTEITSGNASSVGSGGAAMSQTKANLNKVRAVRRF